MLHCSNKCVAFYLAQIEDMDALFEAQFSTLTDSGRVMSKCGKCLRYMKYISPQPSRLYCGTCEEVYYLPQMGTIKVVSNNLSNSINLSLISNSSCSSTWFLIIHDIVKQQTSLLPYDLNPM